jgi:endonuclease III-like uncharacterized protein
MVYSLAFVLKHSSTQYSIHFSLTVGGEEEAVIPGISKGDMDQQIIEYLCKQLRFVNDEQTEQVRQQFYPQFELIQEELGMDIGQVQEAIGDPAKSENLFHSLIVIYKKHSLEDEIDETIFFTDNRVSLS